MQIPQKTLLYGQLVSGQDEWNPTLWLLTEATLPAWDYTPCQTRKPYNKSFIDQACSVEMAE